MIAAALVAAALAVAGGFGFAGGMPPALRDGPVRVLTLPGPTRVVLAPVRFSIRRDVSDVGDGAGCGVRVADQAVTTIGIGDREALSCDALTAAGAMPPTRDGRARIGLIYATHSPNVPQATMIVIVRDSGGRWSVDEATTSWLGDLPEVETLAQMARTLAHGARR